MQSNVLTLSERLSLSARMIFLSLVMLPESCSSGPVATASLLLLWPTVGQLSAGCFPLTPGASLLA